MAGFKVELVHKNSLKRKLRQLPAAYRGGTKSAMNRTGRFVARRARVLAPFDTGELHDSIDWVPDPVEAGGDVEATADHASYVHAGTRRMAGRPFLLQAMLESRGQFRTGLPEAINPRVRKVAAS